MFAPITNVMASCASVECLTMEVSSVLVVPQTVQEEEGEGGSIIWLRSATCVSRRRRRRE